MTAQTRGTPPLAGGTGLELGTMYAAPTAGRMLRDFGARVIKVEDPASGDFARQWTPQHEGLSLGFARLNSGKESIGIDLRRAEGRDLVRRLAATVDVVVESFRPGRLEDWGLGYDVLSAENPGLVLTRVSGFGQTGPYRERPGFGTGGGPARGFGFAKGRPRPPPDVAAVRLRRLHPRALGRVRDEARVVHPPPPRPRRRRRRGAVRAAD